MSDYNSIPEPGHSSASAKGPSDDRPPYAEAGTCSSCGQPVTSTAIAADACPDCGAPLLTNEGIQQSREWFILELKRWLFPKRA